MYRKTTSITVAALTTLAEENYTITDARARVGDVIVVNATAGQEAEWGVLNARVSATGTIVVRGKNFGAGTLTGGAVTIRYAVVR